MTLDLTYPTSRWQLRGRGYLSEVRELTEAAAWWWLKCERGAHATLALELLEVAP